MTLQSDTQCNGKVEDESMMEETKEQDEAREKKELTRAPTMRPTPAAPPSSAALAAAAAAAIVPSDLPAPQHFPSDIWPTPPLVQLQQPNGREDIAASLDSSSCGNLDRFRRAVLGCIVSNYEGSKEKGLMQGDGVAEFKGGQRYEGQWDGGLMHGEGTYTWPDGTTYTGTMSGQSVTGFGRIVWPDGSTYEGHVLDGFRHGFGTFIDPSVPVMYEGEWASGLRHGKGKVTYDENGTSWYEGQWFEGCRHGYGIVKFPSGNMYEGEWMFDRKCGQGTMWWYNRNQKYTGEWKNDKPHGEGEYTWLQLPVANTPTVPTAASTSPGVSARGSNGLGVSIAPRPAVPTPTHFHHPNRYVGSFHQGIREGFGTFLYSNGAIYSGSWHADRKDGEGTFIFTNGSIYEGQFEKDQMKDTNKWRQPYAGVTDMVEKGANLQPSCGPGSPMASKKRGGKGQDASSSPAAGKTQDVSMYDLPIADLLATHASDLGYRRNTQERNMYIANQYELVNSILLRFNTELVDIYRFYASLEVQHLVPEYEAPVLPVQLSVTATGRDHSSPAASSLSPSSNSGMSTRMNLGQLWLLFEDIGIHGCQQLDGSELSLAELNRLVCHRLVAASNKPLSHASRALLPADVRSIHDGRIPLLLRDFIEAFVRIAEQVYAVEPTSDKDEDEDEADHQDDEASSDTASADDDDEMSAISPATLFARAQQSFPLLLTDGSNDVHTLMTNPVQIRAAGSAVSAIAALSISSPATSARSSFSPSNKPASSPISSSPGFGPVPSPSPTSTMTFSSTAKYATPVAAPPRNTLAERLRRFIEEFLLPRAKTRSKHGHGVGASTAAGSGAVSASTSGTLSSFLNNASAAAANNPLSPQHHHHHSFGSSNAMGLNARSLSPNSSGSHMVHEVVPLLTSSSTSTHPGSGSGTSCFNVFRIPTLAPVLKRYEKRLWKDVYGVLAQEQNDQILAAQALAAAVSGTSASHRRASSMSSSLTPLSDRSLTLQSLLHFLQSRSTSEDRRSVFNSYLTLFHLLDHLFGMQGRRHPRLLQGLGIEMVFEQMIDVLVRVALVRMKILHQVADSIRMEKEAVEEIERKRKEEAMAAAEAEKKAMEAAGLIPPDDGTDATNSSNTSPRTAKTGKAGKDGKTSKKAAKGKAAAQLSAVSAAAAASPSPSPSSSTSPAASPLASPVPSSSASVTPSPSSPAPSGRSGGGVDGTLESGSLRRRRDHNLLRRDVASPSTHPLAQANNDMSNLSLHPADSPALNAATQLQHDIEHFFCLILGLPDPEGINPSAPDELKEEGVVPE